MNKNNRNFKTEHKSEGHLNKSYIINLNHFTISLLIFWKPVTFGDSAA